MNKFFKTIFAMQYDFACNPKMYTGASPKYVFSVLTLMTIVVSFALSALIIQPLFDLDAIDTLFVVGWLVLLNNHIMMALMLMANKIGSWFDIPTEEIQVQPVAFFKLHETVVHVKSGRTYIISAIPDHRRLENTNEQFYEYQDVMNEAVWVRSKSEMEDGRFQPEIRHQSV